MTEAKAIKIAINALGGQGGGVLANWIVKAGEKAGYIAQATSVPGVAQRTGATVYYIELFPEAAAQAKGKAPVLALMPAPGDVDIVIASEMMEAGRAITRGFVTAQTTLIASSHRVYAIGEKIAMSDGRISADIVEERAISSAGRFILADMDAIAARSGAVISAVLFGALAGSGALPIARTTFEETIREGRRSVDNNLAAFANGYDSVGKISKNDAGYALPKAHPSAGAAAKVQPLLETLAHFPAKTHFIMREGLKKVVDFQGEAYGALYLKRLEAMGAVDEETGGDRRDWRLLNQTAKHLALWMAYEDAARVAELKTRKSRFERFRRDVKANDGQIVHVFEYMHPRVEEFCDLLPAGIARAVMETPALNAPLKFLLGKGRRVPTTKLRGFFMLSMVASLKGIRRASYRYQIEQQRIEEWLALVGRNARDNYALACETVALQRLIKGYGDTHERGLRNYTAIIARMDEVRRQPDAASALKTVREAALQDEEGAALEAALMALAPSKAAA